MALNHLSNDKSKSKQSQAEDFFKIIFSQQGGGFLEIRAFPGPRQYFFSIPSELSKAAALAVNLRNQADYFGPRNRERRLQRFSTEVPSLLNTSTGSLLGIKAVSCHANVG